MVERAIREFFDKWGDEAIVIDEWEERKVKLNECYIRWARPIVSTRAVAKEYRDAIERLRGVIADLEELVRRGVKVELRKKEEELGEVGVTLQPGKDCIIVCVDDVVLDVIGDSGDPIDVLKKLLKYLEAKLPQILENKTPWRAWIGKSIVLFAPPWSAKRVNLAEAVRRLEELAEAVRVAEEVFVPIYTVPDDTCAVKVRIPDTFAEQWIEVVIPRALAEEAGVTKKTRPSTALTRIAQRLREITTTTSSQREHNLHQDP